MSWLRGIVFSIGLAGFLLFGGAWLASIVAPGWVEQIGREVVRQQVEKRTGEKLQAQAMKDCGFLTDLADGADITAAVQQLQTTLAGMAPLALLGMKKHLNAIARGMQDRAGIDAAVQATIASADLQEGGLAWREKRRPQFTGR